MIFNKLLLTLALDFFRYPQVLSKILKPDYYAARFHSLSQQQDIIVPFSLLKN